MRTSLTTFVAAGAVALGLAVGGPGAAAPTGAAAPAGRRPGPAAKAGTAARTAC